MALQHFCTWELWVAVMWSQAAEMCAEVFVEAGHADVVALVSLVASLERSMSKINLELQHIKTSMAPRNNLARHLVIPPGMSRSSLQKKKVWICC